MAIFWCSPNVSIDRPADWLVANADLIPSRGAVLDVASGSGRNAMFLATHGWRVHAIDRDRDALDRLAALSETCQYRITTECRDLETGTVTFGRRCYQAVIVFNYLHRPLMPAIVEAVADDGVLIYETFTRAQSTRGRPRNPEFLLEEGELPVLVAPLRTVRSREGDIDGKFVASVVAMR
jgi:protein-L-isoaspartate O-methyltransferase